MKSTPTLCRAVLLTLYIIFSSFLSRAGGLGNDTIYSAQTICYNTIPVALTGTTPTGGIGVYTYVWQKSTTSASAGFANISGATSTGYAPGALTVNTWYRRISNSGILSDTAAVIGITVTPIITAASNTIAAAQTICNNTAPATITGSTPTGGNGVYSYAWQSAPDNATWTTIAGDNSISVSPPALTVTTYYRRIVSSGTCSSTSASVKITVSPVIANNTITANQSICSGQTPLALTGATPTGGSGLYTYLWQSSTVSATSGYATATGTTNGINYTPGSLSQTTWFRRVVSSGGCTDSSAIVQITAVTSAPGNPTVFGNNVWNAYAYSDNAFTTYAGYYTFPQLSFISTQSYTTAQSPSSAAGYQGCLIQPTYFSVSFKRTNFTPGDYQIDLTGVDDNIYLIIDGVQVYTHGCCIDPPTVVSNIWTGYLGPTDQVEIRWSQNAGPSIAGMNFTAVTPAPLNPGAIGGSQSVCYGQQPANAFTNTTTPTSGCSIINGYQWQSSVDSVTWTNISGATALTYAVPSALTATTWYRRVTTDACDNSAATIPVKVTVNVVAPGNPTVFGNGVWNDYVYSDDAFTTYAGYYTEPLLSFITTSRYTTAQSPSSASGYQGCLVNPTYFSVSMKRTNFMSAIYQIDLTADDDQVFLLINGIQVYTKGCCTVPASPVYNIWTGPLGPTDQVEIRWVQFAGGSDVGMNFTPVTPTTLQPSVITPSQTICMGNVPPTPLTQSTAPSGGCYISGYQWELSTNNGSSWAPVSGATAASYTITNSIYAQTLYRQVAYDVCGDSAASLPDTIYMNNSAPGNPAVFGNNVWNVYCYQDVNFSIYAGYYTEPNLTFQTTSRYPATSPPSDASGYQGCQLVNTYYSTSMKRTGFTAGTYQIDVTLDDDFTQVYIDGSLVSSLTYPTVQNNIWTGNLGPTDEIEVRWGNYGGPGNTGVRFTLVTPTPLVAGAISADNPNLCPGNLPVINNVTAASGGCYTSYYWQSSIDGGTTWTLDSGATGTSYTAATAPTGNIEYERVAVDICGDTAITAAVSFIYGGGAIGNPAVYGAGQWNVYCYNANTTAFSTATYMGYYVEPLLSFNSANRWNSNTGSPSDASGYQGCQVDHDNDWVSYRQKGFPPGTYQLNIPDHDDDVYLYIDGNLVFSQTGCCVATNNVWTGNLGAGDSIEYRWRQYYGGSIGELTFVPVTPPTSMTAGTIGTSQTICYNSTPAAFTTTTAAASTCFVYYQWQSAPATTGPWTNIGGATASNYSVGSPLTANTVYRQQAYDACGDTAYSNIVTVSLYSNTLNPGTIGASQTICAGSVPAALTSTALPSGGDGNDVYQWQSSPDNVVWTNITGATGTGYSPGALSAITYFRRNVTCCAGALSATSGVVTITVNQLPAITIQPANAVACSGGNTSISVTATGTSLTYQWQVNPGTGWVNATNGAIYGGATTSTLSITGVTALMNGYTYRVVVSGACTPAVTSNTVTLTIGTNPTISSQPGNTTVCVGSIANFYVTASGSGLAYQWQQKIGSGAFTNITNGGIYGGSQTNNLVLTGVTAAMSGYTYQCVITSSCGGTVTSVVASLTVVAAITNTVAANQTICAGMVPATLTGSTGTGYTYLWQSSTVSGASGFVTASGTSNGSNYSANPGSTSTWYQRVVSNTGCSSTSNVVSVTVNPTAISISAQPVNQPICAGGTANFSVTTTGPGTLTYQWYENRGSGWNALTDGGVYSGSATSSLTLTGVPASMSGYTYYVKIFSSGCTSGSLNSNAASLTTNNSPVITTNGPATLNICQGNTTSIAIGASGIGLTYQWQLNTGSGWNNLGNNATYGNVNGSQMTLTGVTNSMSGLQYRCVVTGSCSPGAASTATTLAVDGPLTNSISQSQTLCAGTPQPFTASTPTGGNGSYTYQWEQNTGSGWSNITGATSVNYSPVPLTQTTSYLRYVSDGVCNNNSASITMTITPGTSTGNPSNTTVCAGTNASFSVVAVGTNLSYQWQVNTGSGIFSNITNGSQYTGSTSATLTIVAPAYTLNGYQYQCVVSGNCSPSSVTSSPATLTVNPVALISSQPANVSSCQGSTVSFSVTASGSGLTYQWYQKVGSGVFSPTTDGGIYSGSATPTLTLTGISTAMNNNQYMVVITDGACPVSSSTASLTVNADPMLVITNPAAVCAPATVNLTAAAVTSGSNLAGGVLSYWQDAATTIPLTNPTTVAVSGTYYIRVATSPVCYAVSPVVATINAVIAGNTIGAAQSICTGTAPVPLTGSTPSGGNGTYTYQWLSSPDNATWSGISGATGVNYSPGALTSSAYYERVVTSGACSNTSTSIEITVVAYPTAGISYGGSPYCATGTAAVTQTGTAGGTYSSTTGLSINATTGAINLATSTAGTYTVTYAFTNGTCSNTTTTSVTINALATATIAYGGSPYCATGTATVTQTGTAGGTYSSTSGLSINATTGAINLATSTAGTYTVTYSFTNGTCSNTTTTTVTINALPTAAISYSGSPYCATGTAAVTQTGTSGGTYSSTAGLSINATTGAINLATSTAGTYTVIYTFTNGTCSNTTTTSVTINALPMATIAYTGSPYCATGTATATQTGTAGGTYSSTTGLSINATTGAINLVTSTAGTYTVIYTFTNGTCSNTTTTSVTINALPTATITYSGSPYCATGTAAVTQTGTAGGTYSTTTGLSINMTTGTINLATSTAGTYTVTYSFSNGTCSNTTTTSVTINALPTATIAYGGSPYCATGTATVTQTGTSGGTYSSTTGLVIDPATGAINLVTSTAGIYTVTYAFTNGTCSNTTTTTVTINALPTATISYTGSPYCATGTATVTRTGQGGGTYSSIAGLIINATTGVINLATSTAGTYTVTYAFTNGTCSNTTTTSVMINALPTAAISYGASPYCATGTATVTQTGTSGGTYSSTTGLVIDPATGAINLAASTAGTYTVTYSFTNGTCSNTTTTSVTINALPTATIVYTGSPYCATGTATVTRTGQGGGTYSSTAGLTINATTGAINLAASTAGTYTVTYSFTNGTCSNTITTSVTINALPTAAISYAGTPYCATGTAAVTQTGTSGGIYSSTTGLVIDPVTGTINLATSAAGTYTVTYAFTNGTCSNTTTTSVTINALPMATIAYTGSPYCATGTAAVTQTGTAGGTYSSTAGLSINAATGAVDLVSSTAGTYTVTYSFSNGTCSNTITTSVTINALPTATIAYSGSPYCATGTATVTQTGQGGGAYSSTAGLSINSTTGAINLVTSTAGTYTVTYSFTNGTCSNTTTTPVTINALPTAAIAYGGSPYCAIGTATVTQTGTSGGTYSSTTGLVIDPVAGMINLATSTAGTYTVTYTFTNGTCSNTTTTTVTINALPTATISYAGSPYCAIGTAAVTQTGISGGTYNSTTGLSINATTGAINLVTSTAGTYTVTYSYTNGTCNNTTTTTVTINALPTATIAYSGSPYCATGTATVTQTGISGGTYSSTTGLIINATTGAVNLAASTAGTYTVAYSFSNGTCSNTVVTTITVIALPSATISYAANPYCTTGAATVTQTGPTGGIYSSTAGLTINSNNGTVDLAASSPGTYTVTYSFSAGACSNTTTTTILLGNPALSIDNPPAVCAPATVNLTAANVTAGSAAGLSYSYFSDAGGTSPVGDPAAMELPGTYYIRGTIPATGCTTAMEPVIVQINEPPTLTLTGDTDVCKGSPDTLMANSPGSAINWLNVGTGDSVVINPMVTATYEAVATNAPGCTATAEITVHIRPFTVTLTATPEPVLSGNTVTLTTAANFSYQVIAWEPEVTFQDQTAVSQTFTVHDTATQFYVIAESSQGCLDTAGYSVDVDPNLKDFFIPNAFTPNNDGKNDVFKVYGSSIREVEMKIFSQWGQLVFESHDPQGDWDGTMGGHPAPVGIYLYAIKVVFTNDHTLNRKGTVSLIR